jgi:hypothetical protein
MVDEYQKVAALLCLDIDTVMVTAERHPDMALGLLKMLKERKDNMVNDPVIRDVRYSACCTVFNLPVNKDA